MIAVNGNNGMKWFPGRSESQNQAIRQPSASSRIVLYDRGVGKTAFDFFLLKAVVESCLDRMKRPINFGSIQRFLLDEDLFLFRGHSSREALNA